MKRIERASSGVKASLVAVVSLCSAEETAYRSCPTEENVARSEIQQNLIASNPIVEGFLMVGCAKPSASLSFGS